MGVPISDPKVPPFEIVKVPPCMSSIEIFPSFPFLAKWASPWYYGDYYNFKVVEFHILAISKDGDEKSCGSWNGNWDINEISPNDLIAIDDWVDNGVLLKCEGCCF